MPRAIATATPGPGALPHGERAWRNTLVMPPAAWLLLFVVVPLGIMLYFSLLTEVPGPATKAAFTLGNYAKFLSKGFYRALTWKSIAMGMWVTAICLAISYPMAYYLAKVVRRLQTTLLLLVIIPFWSSFLVRAYSWVTLFMDGGVLEQFLKRLHLVSGPLNLLFTYPAIIVALVHIYFPYMVLTLFVSIEKIDDRLLEAAQTLGSRPWSTFYRVVLPLSLPGVIAGSILVFIPAIGSFVEPRILGGVNGAVIGTVIEDQFLVVYNWPLGSALAFILLLIMLLVLGGATGIRRLMAGAAGGER